MMYKKATVVVMLSLLLGVLGSALAVKHASAHGTMEDPPSRVYQCYKENPMHPISDACKAGVALYGPQHFYDWNVVSANYGGKHREMIPDGKLCSANRPGSEALDLPRADWVAKTISPDQNGNATFIYLASAPHATKSYDFYITKDSYDPTKPLKWSDLEDTPFCRANAPVVNGRYTLTCPLPNKPGKRVIYNIWERSDSAEAFYSCIDVIINTNGAAATATPVAATPTPAAPTATPTKIVPTATPQPGVTRTPVSATPTPTKVVATATPQPGGTTTPGAPTPTLIPTRPGNDTSTGTIKAYLPLVTK